MKKLHFTPLLFLVISLLIISCNKDEDKTTTPPAPEPENLTISLTNPTESPSFDAGGNIEFKAIFEDKVALGENYKIKINSVSSPTDTLSPAYIYEPRVWVYEKEFKMNKTDPKRSVEQKTIEIRHEDYYCASVIGGTYIFTVSSTNKAGKAQIKSVKITIKERKPEPKPRPIDLPILIDNPRSCDIFAVGEVINFYVRFEDKKGLASFKIAINPVASINIAGNWNYDSNDIPIEIKTVAKRIKANFIDL